jgi:succinoglycan biosynthesis transport protein ExoP
MYLGPDPRAAHYQLPSGAPPSAAEPTDHAEITGILSTLWRRRRLFLAIFLSCFGLVVLFTLIIPKKYTAEIKLIAGASSPTAASANSTDVTTLPLLNALLAAGNTMSSETYTDLIQEYPVAEQVIQNLHLNIDPYDLLQYDISVTPVTNTSIIALDATMHSPEQAIKVANEFGKVFVQRERDLIAGQASSALNFLSKQMPIAEANMNKADGALAQFESTHPNVYLAGADSTDQSSSVVAAQQRYAQAQVDQGQAAAELSNVMAQMASMRPTITGQSQVVQNPVTAQLQAQLAQVEVQYDAARKQYTDQHPTVIALKEQKDQLEREIASQPSTIVSGNDIMPNPVYQQLSQQAATLRAQIASDKAQMKTLGLQMGQTNSGKSSLPAETTELADLQRNAKMAEDIYSALQQKYGEATVAQTTALSDVTITQPADMSTVSERPSWITNLVLGILLGLVMATAGVFVVDLFDNTFKDEQDTQRLLPLPLLTSVPALTHNGHLGKLGTGAKTASGKLPWLRALTVESFLQLVTALRYSSDKPLRTLAITSPCQRDGKTTVAMSTGIAMAQIEPKVLLVDADLRKPTIHKRFGLLGTPGLSDVLVGEAELKDAIQATKYDGLYLLASGTLVPNPVRLIHSPKFGEIIVELQREYRAIIFDTPAIQPVYDAVVLSAKCDGTVLVVSAGMTDVRSTKQAIQRLSSAQGVNLLGFVLNRVTPANGYETYYLTTDAVTPLPHEDAVETPT